MRNIYEILREKELQMKTLEKEIEALRVVARILQEEEDKGVSTGAPKLSSEPAWKITAPAATETSPATRPHECSTRSRTANIGGSRVGGSLAEGRPFPSG